MNAKKYFLLAACCLCFFSFGKNILDNSSFETISDGKPVKWKQNKPKDFEGVTFELVESNVRSGKYSAQIKSTNPMTRTNHFLAYIQNIDVARLDP